MYIPLPWVFVVLGTLAAIVVWCATDVARHREEARKARLLAESDEVVALREWRGILERKVSEQFKVIGGVIKERDAWHDWYIRDAREYGAAQSMMMQAIEHLERRLAAAGKPVDRPPGIAALQAHLTKEREEGAATAVLEHSVPDPPVPPESIVRLDAAGEAPAVASPSPRLA